MIVETVAILAGIKHAIDIGGQAKEAISITEKQEKIELLVSKLIDIKMATLDLIEENRQLKIEQNKRAEFEIERKRYVFHELAPGVFVYRFDERLTDPDDRIATPAHYICTSCYEQGKKGYMQRFTQDFAGTHYRCGSCKSEIIDHSNRAQMAIGVSVSVPSRRDKFRGY